ncbi:MAG: hypothetical protein WD229_02610, partial [Pirellulales bacterium]
GPAAAGAPPGNPYAAPLANEREDGQAIGPVTTSGQLDIGRLMSESWELYKLQLLPCIAAQLILGIASMVLTLLLASVAIGGFLLVANSWPLDAPATVSMILVLTPCFVLYMFGVGWLQAGAIRFFLGVSRLGDAPLSELFSAGSAAVFLCGARLLLGVLIGLGTLACLVPGILLFLMFSQVSYAVVDRRSGIIEAFHLSRRLTEGHKLELVVVYLVMMALSYLAGMVPCGLGVLFVAPYIQLLLSVTYLFLSGQSTAVSAASEPASPFAQGPP